MRYEIGTFILVTTHQYGRVMYEVVENDVLCPHCGENDFHTLEVVADRNVGYWAGQYNMPNERKSMSIKQCYKRIQKDREKNPNEFKIITDSQELEYRNKLLAIDDEY